jgi:hypothetical protein
MRSETIWLPADAELPVCVKRTIANENRLLIVFWEIHRIAHYCWLPKDSILDSPFFCEEVLSAESTRSDDADKFQRHSQTFDFHSYGQCKGSDGKGNPREIGYFPIQAHTAATVWPGYCTIRLFIFGWLETQLERRENNGEDEFYEVVDEILTGLSIEIIETVFIDWMNRRHRLIDGNGDYVSYNITSEFLNWIKQWQAC